MICILIQGKATGGRGGEGSDVEKGGGEEGGEREMDGRKDQGNGGEDKDGE